MGKLINSKALTPGMMILRVTEQNGPVRIKKTGLVTSQAMVQGLIEMGIQQVEIDPEQTVEIEPKQVKKSTTRQMLESNNVTNTRIDDGLSDHFHRSLFLPSVQDIPSAWLFYTKRYAVALLIATGGFGLGWVLSHYEDIQTAILAAPVVDTRAVKPDAQAEGPNSEQKLDAAALEIKEQPRAVNPSETTATKQSQVDNTLDVPNPAPEKLIEEPKPVPEPSAEVEPAVSADLLARFRDAVSQVGDKPVESSVQDNNYDSDVPRIDQLPVWVLTELPNMSFSAHMYATSDTERWVRVNGARMVEGDMIEGAVEIISISPQIVVLSYKGHEFSMDALTDW